MTAMRRLVVTLLLAVVLTLNPGIVIVAGATGDEPAEVISSTATLGPVPADVSLPVDEDGRTVQYAELSPTHQAGIAAVTWTEAAPEEIYLRQTTDGVVGAWTPVDADPGPTTPTAEGGTDPIVITDAQRVEAVTVSSSAAEATFALYESPEPKKGTTFAVGVSTAKAATTSDYAWSNPQIRSRASWGADEGLVRYAYTYAQVTGAMIHHTAGSNTYTEADVPGILRSIQTYHVTGRGWNDIAYNILVDKFGRAWEGRGGGVNKAVQGGHAWGVTNARVTGVSLLGNFQTATPTAAMLETTERVIAWKFALYNVNPLGTTYGSGGQDGGSTFLNAISGHRDENATDCPGINVYSKFATIRSKVVGYLPQYKTPTATTSPKPTTTPTTTAPKPTTTAPKPTTATFTDVAVGSQYFADIEWMATKGISTGWLEDDGTRTYRPTLPVARDAMAAFFYRAAGSPSYTPPATSPFTDITPSDQFYKEVAWMAAKGISTGWLEADGTRTFRPLQSTARDAMAAFLYRSAGSPAFTAPASSPFTDITPTTQFFKEMTWMNAKGISTGWAETNGTRTFRPALAVTRESMAVFLHKLKG